MAAGKKNGRRSRIVTFRVRKLAELEKIDRMVAAMPKGSDRTTLIRDRLGLDEEAEKTAKNP